MGCAPGSIAAEELWALLSWGGLTRRCRAPFFCPC